MNNIKQPTSKVNYFDVIEHPLIWQWMQETARRDPDSFGILADNNYQRFRLIFGKPAWQQKGPLKNLNNSPLKSGNTTHRKTKTYRWYGLGEGLQWLIETGTEGTILRIRSEVPLNNFKQDPLIGLGGVAYLKRLLNIITGVENYHQ